MKKQNINKQVMKMVVFIVLTLVLGKLSAGYILPVFAFAGIVLALFSKLAWALVIFAFMPFLAELNPALLPKAGMILGLSLRFGPLLIGLILAVVGASRQGHHRLPLIWIVPFLMAAVVSSIDGWVPAVSYMKLLNFSVFLLGIWFGTQNLQERPQDVFLFRSFFLAAAAVVTFGSILLIPFPGISYATSLSSIVRQAGGELAAEVIKQMKLEGGTTLFCGITNHSQTLAGLLSCFFPLVLCDMLFVERRFNHLHVIILMAMLPLFYMTRSRMALVSLVTSMLFIAFYTSRNVLISVQLKRKLMQGIFVFTFFLSLLAIVMQLHSGMISRWLRKTGKEDVDDRSLGEALTSSRMGLIEESLWEFRRKPMIGSGFQVAAYTRDMVAGNRSLILSAPIEKGVLPVMVLGETGILGVTCFLLFLLTFYYTCARRRYFITITMFTVQQVTNMAEATFFSPGGSGGLQWIVCVVGGFVLDTILLYHDNIQTQWQKMGIVVMAPTWEIAAREPQIINGRRIQRYGMKRNSMRKV